MMTKSAVQLKRAYDDPSARDGARVLVDRLWPRGVSKEAAKLDAWMKELGPSDALRTWFGHQPERWTEFAAKYRTELESPMRQTLLAALQGAARESTLTLVYGARDSNENEAVVLRDDLSSERAKPAADWDAATRLLVIADAVAAGKPDGVAPESTVRRFTSALLSDDDYARARAALLADGELRETGGGWSVAERARRQVHKLRE